MNEFVETLRAKDDMGAFRRRYRECDVLLIDDVQFMDKKESLQEELFHTFNSLYGSSKQIVLTSDRPPRAIATLEDRLRSRLLSGLTTDIQPPELETRIAILRTKAEHEHAVVGDDVLDFIATMVKENIRELEGALIRVTAFASLNRQPLTRELAESVLADFVASRQPRQITAQQIIETSAEHFGFSVEELIGPEPAAASRDRPADRDVPVPRAHRLQLSGHRPGVQRPRPHDRHPRRREDLRAHEGAPAGVRPSHRAQRSDQKRLTSLWTTALQAGTIRQSVPRRWPAESPACVFGGYPNGKYTPREQGKALVFHIPQGLLLLLFSFSNSKGVEHSVKFRADRDTLLDTLVTAARATSGRPGPNFGVVGLRLLCAGDQLEVCGFGSRPRDRGSLPSRRRHRRIRAGACSSGRGHRSFVRARRRRSGCSGRRGALLLGKGGVRRAGRDRSGDHTPRGARSRRASKSRGLCSLRACDRSCGRRSSTIRGPRSSPGFSWLPPTAVSGSSPPIRTVSPFVTSPG